MLPPADRDVLHFWQSSDELGGVDVHQHVVAPGRIMTVARRRCDAHPSRSVRWQCTHRIARREHHGEGERDERVDDEPEHYTQGSFGTSAGEERLPVVVCGLVLLVWTSEARSRHSRQGQQ